MVKLSLVLLCGLSAAASAQNTASLEGHIRDGRTKQPLPNATVAVVGGNVTGRTDDSGYFRLTSLPAGALSIRIEHSGYASSVEEVDVIPGAQADFQLFSSATVLDAIMVNARAKKPPATRDGASSADVRTDDKTETANSSSELVARVPGAMVLSGGQLGSGSSIRLRGLKTIIGNGNPLIYLDGVRVSGGEPRAGGGQGGGSMFRKYNEPTVLDQLDPMSIDHIEVLPGAAATAMYGTGGANGVILIYTKR